MLVETSEAHFLLVLAMVFFTPDEPETFAAGTFMTSVKLGLP